MGLIIEKVIKNLDDVLADIQGKNVVLLDNTNFLLRMNGKISVKDSGLILLEKGKNTITILKDSIIEVLKIESNIVIDDQTNYRFKLHNGHTFDIIYE